MTDMKKGYSVLTDKKRLPHSRLNDKGRLQRTTKTNKETKQIRAAAAKKRNMVKSGTTLKTMGSSVEQLTGMLSAFHGGPRDTKRYTKARRKIKESAELASALAKKKRRATSGKGQMK